MVSDSFHSDFLPLGERGRRGGEEGGGEGRLPPRR